MRLRTTNNNLPTVLVIFALALFQIAVAGDPSISDQKVEEAIVAFIQATDFDNNKKESLREIKVLRLNSSLSFPLEATVTFSAKLQMQVSPAFVNKNGAIVFWGISPEKDDVGHPLSYITADSRNLLDRTIGIKKDTIIPMSKMSDLIRLSPSYKELESKCITVAEARGFLSADDGGGRVIQEAISPQKPDVLFLRLRCSNSSEYHEYLSGTNKGYPFFDMLFLHRPSSGEVRHILGDTEERINIYPGGFSTDGRYSFLSIANHLSESESMQMSFNLGKASRETVAKEPAWNLRVLDLETLKMDLLTTGGFRSQSYPTGQVPAPQWSPDNKRIAFVHSKESFFADRLHNECDGLYVYDLEKKTYWRPTDKWMQEEPIGWAPDSKRILLRKMRHFDFPPERETRPEGIYWVNVDTREEKQIGGATSDARDTCWSPDGLHIFLLTRDEKSNSHILEIVRADDPSDRIEVKRIPIKEGDKMNFILGQSWLDPNLKQPE
jgi:hypothetical protein